MRLAPRDQPAFDLRGATIESCRISSHTRRTAEWSEWRSLFGPTLVYTSIRPGKMDDITGNNCEVQFANRPKQSRFASQLGISATAAGENHVRSETGSPITCCILECPWSRRYGFSKTRADSGRFLT